MTSIVDRGAVGAVEARRTRFWRLIGTVMVVVALVAMAFVAFGGPPGRASADPATTGSPYFQVTVTPDQGLTDGEPMTVTVTVTSAAPSGTTLGAIATGWCLPNAPLPTRGSGGSLLNSSPESGFPEAQGTVDGIQTTLCTDAYHSLNGDLLSLSAISPTADGPGTSVTGSIIAQTGEVTLAAPGPGIDDNDNGATLTCDAGDPCTLGVAVFANNNNIANFGIPYLYGIPVTFAPATADAACGGSAPGQLTSVGSDRLGPAVTAWTIDACRADEGAGKALTQYTSSEQSDDTALCGFASGQDDLAYSAVGYDATGAPGYGTSPDFEPADCPSSVGSDSGPQPDRPYVAVPVALNAVVLADSNDDSVHNVENAQEYAPFPTEPDITVDQLAQLLADPGSWDGPLGAALLQENPQFDPAPGGEFTGMPQARPDSNQLVSQTGNSSYGVVATSGTDATSLFATAFLHSLDPTELGTTSNLGTADPPLAIFPFTGQPLLTKAAAPITGQEFVLTNAASAAATWGGLQDFELQTTSGSSYVAPTEASMQAAVSDMTVHGGMLLPDLGADAGPVNGVEPYPLTYVEYAIAPTQPLLNADCTPNTQSEEDLVDWLNYVTSNGQTELPNGLAPLPPSLQEQAAAAIAQVGQAAPACTPTTTPTTTTPTTTTPTTTPTTTTPTTVPTTTTTPTTVPATSALSPGGFGASAFSPTTDIGGSSGLPGGASGSHGPDAPGSAPLSQASSTHGREPNPAMELAGFRSVAGTNWALPVGGVILLLLLLPGLALLISGRSFGEALAEIRSRLGLRGDRPPDGGGPS